MFSSNEHNRAKGNSFQEVHTGDKDCQSILLSGATQLPEPKLCTAKSGHGSVQPATWGDVSTPEPTVHTKSTEDPGRDTGQS